MSALIYIKLCPPLPTQSYNSVIKRSTLLKVEINLLGYVTKKLHFCNTEGILFFSDYPNALYCRHGGLIARTLFSGWRDPISKHGQDYCLLFDFPLTLLTLFFSFLFNWKIFHLSHQMSLLPHTHKTHLHLSVLPFYMSAKL